MGNFEQMKNKPTPPPLTPPAVKPRRMWACARPLVLFKCQSTFTHNKTKAYCIPVIVIDARPESIEAMRENLARAMLANPDTWTTSDNPETPRELIELILRAISPHLVAVPRAGNGTKGKK